MQRILLGRGKPFGMIGLAFAVCAFANCAGGDDDSGAAGSGAGEAAAAGNAGSGGTAGQGGSAGKATGGTSADCYGRASCRDGVISLNSTCASSRLECELGCRSDFGSDAISWRRFGPVSETEARVLCEENRLQNGPRRPGDPCRTDYDCLAFPASSNGIRAPLASLNAPWTTALRCDDGICAEGSLTPSDYGEPCERVAGEGGAGGEGGARAETVWESSACDSGICVDFNGPVCTKPCVAHEDCPGRYACASSNSSDTSQVSICDPSAPPSDGGAGGAAN